MLVAVRLKGDITPDFESEFLRWTKMHFRDLLNVDKSWSDSATVRPISHESRFTSPHEGSKYSHTDFEKLAPYMYITHLNDISYVHSQSYAGLSRRYDLENTRALEAGEEPVGCKENRSVFEVCKAEFGVFEVCKAESRVFELVDGKSGMFTVYPPSFINEISAEASLILVDPLGGPSFQNLEQPGEKQSHLVGIYLPPSRDDAASVQEELVDNLSKALSLISSEILTSLYKYAGDAAQPPGTPVLPGLEEGSHFIAAMVISGEANNGSVRGEIEKSVEKVVGNEDEGWWGVWEGELFLQ